MKRVLPLAVLMIGFGIWALSVSIGSHEEITLFGSAIDPRVLQVGGLFSAIGGILTILNSFRSLQLKSS